MSGKKIILWVSKLGHAWIDRQPLLIPPLFSDKFQYFETPFDKPYTTKEGLKKLWEDVPKSQKDIKFNFDIMHSDNHKGIIHWHAQFTRIPSNIKAVLDGIFYIELDNEGLCTLFKQWWVSK